jgi:protein arginine kinase
VNTHDFSTRGGSWLRQVAEHQDVVLSSRVRLARNVSGYLFPNRISPESKEELERVMRESIEQVDLGEKLRYVNLTELDPILRQMLCERYLISRELAQATGDRGVAFSLSERTSLMIHEEDHLRIQVLRAGCAMEEALEAAIQIDRKLEVVLPYAYSESFGYLTSCPTNTGTGLRMSVMMHVPGITMTEQIDTVTRSASKVGLTVRGFSGEGTGALGDLIQISNQQTLGRDEDSILRTVQRLVLKIMEFERGVRDKMMATGRLGLEDRIWRALGTLRYARLLSSEEALKHLSAIRMGCALKLLPEIALADMNELIITTQPGHLQVLKSRALGAEERDQVRAQILRDRLQKSAP